MDEVWKQLGTPVFWICSFGFSLLGGLVVHFFTKGLDRRISGWSAARQARREAASAQFAADLKLLSDHADMAPLYASAELRARSAGLVLAFSGMVLEVLNALVLLGNGPKVTTTSGLLSAAATALALLLIWRGGDAFAESRRQGGVLQALFATQRLERVAEPRRP